MAKKKAGTKRPTKRSASKELLGDVEGLPSVLDVKKNAKTLKAQLAAYEDLIDKQQRRIEFLTKDTYQIPRQRKVTARSKKSFNRVVIPDTHGSRAEWSAIHAMLADIENLKPREVVLLGDHIDCSGFLAQHHTLGFVSETEYTFEDDVKQANLFLDALQKAAPGAKIYYLEGNHEERLEKWAINQSLRNGADAKFLLQHIGVPNVLHLEKRNIEYFSKGKKHHNLPVQGTIKLGSCYFTHGTRHGKSAAQSMLARFSAPVVFGHIHKLLSTSDNTVKNGSVSAWSCGCLCELQPTWKHGDPSDWGHGYGVQRVHSDGTFAHQNVPIIDGVSYLPQFA